MELKNIIAFEMITLNKFIVQINFSNDFTPFDLRYISEFAGKIENEFPIGPKFMLMPKPGEPIDLGPLIFRNNEDGTNTVQIGRNSLSFVFTEYNSWILESEKIMNVINHFNQIFELPKVKNIIMTYVDHFKFDADSFSFSKYFAFPINPNNKWSIENDDFFLGIVPYQKISEESKRKLVLRLRTIGKSDGKLLYSLESVFIRKELSISIDDTSLKTLLQDAHDYLIHFFIEFLTEDHQKELKLITGSFTKED